MGKDITVTSVSVVYTWVCERKTRPPWPEVQQVETNRLESLQTSCVE